MHCHPERSEAKPRDLRFASNSTKNGCPILTQSGWESTNPTGAVIPRPPEESQQTFVKPPPSDDRRQTKYHQYFTRNTAVPVITPKKATIRKRGMALGHSSNMESS